LDSYRDTVAGHASPWEVKNAFKEQDALDESRSKQRRKVNIERLMTVSVYSSVQGRSGLPQENLVVAAHRPFPTHTTTNAGVAVALERL
jgi:hypothetical protein